MALVKISTTTLLFACLVILASSQGYMGTVSTGTGILSPLTVGSGSSSPVVMGAISSQVNLTGSWSLDLKGKNIKHLDLQILQESDMIVGSGTMTSNGASHKVAVAGSAAGDRPTIFVAPFNQTEAFRLKLSASRTALAGEYDLLSAGGVRESGTITGSVALATKQGSPTVLGTGTNPSATSGAFVGAAAQNQG